MAIRIVLIFIIILLVVFLILPFILNMAGIQIFQFGSVGGGSARSAGEGMLLSEDGGENWGSAGFSEEKRTSFPKEIFDIAFHPEDPNIIFLATKSSGIWRSDTRGKSWKQVKDASGALGSGADVYKVSVARSNPDIIYALVFQNNRGRVLKSENNGQSFKEIYLEAINKVGVFDIHVNPLDASHVIIVTGRGGLLESKNGGESWRVKKWFSEPLVKLLVNPRNSAEIVVISSRGAISRTTDGGANWLEVKENIEGESGGTGAPTFSYPPDVSFNPLGSFARAPNKILVADPQSPSTLYLVSSRGLLRSTNGGTSWRSIPLLLEPRSLSVSSLAIHPRDSQTIFITTDGQLHTTRDGGNNWSVDILPTKSSLKSVHIHPLKPEIMFALLGR